MQAIKKYYNICFIELAQLPNENVYSEAQTHLVAQTHIDP